MSAPSPARPSRFRLLIAVVLTLVVAVPASVFAIDRFSDVPNSNTFHSSITWLADNSITLGCNPPTNDQFCPDDNVTREQMAAFMRRLAQTFGNAGAQVNAFENNIEITESTLVPILSIEVTPKAAADVVLNAHVTLEKPTSSEGRYVANISRGDCSGPVVGSGWWRGNTNSEATFEANTISFTGSDSISTDTTYVLCVADAIGTSPDATASRRGLTATWLPDA